MQLVAGVKINNSVRLVRPLGEGGMGAVWVAHHEALDTEVAVKVISATLAGNQTLVERFKQEASLAAKIKSPHVVQMLDHGLLSSGAPFIVMELMEGESLAERLERTGPLSLDEAGALLGQACQALGKAHALGIVHRDLKPDNLFLLNVDYSLFVKVLDFGIAKKSDNGVDKQLTGTGAVLGTPHYMSPEQLLSTKHVDGRSDLWAMAVVMYEALCGRVPFDGETLAGLSIQICQADPPPIGSILTNSPPGVERWFRKALAKTPDERFQTAEALLKGFKVALEIERSIRGGEVSVDQVSDEQWAATMAVDDDPFVGMAPPLPANTGTVAAVPSGQPQTGAPYPNSAAPHLHSAAPHPYSAAPVSAGLPVSPPTMKSDAPAPHVTASTLQGASSTLQQPGGGSSVLPWLFAAVGMLLIGGAAFAYVTMQQGGTEVGVDTSPPVAPSVPTSAVPTSAVAASAAPTSSAAASASAAPSAAASGSVAVAAPPPPRPRAATPAPTQVAPVPAPPPMAAAPTPPPAVAPPPPKKKCGTYRKPDGSLGYQPCQ